MTLRYGLDFHGVIDSNPDFYAAFTKALISAGWEVHILTGSKITPEFKAQLEIWRINYTHLFSIVDYHESIGTKIEWKETGPWIDEDLWNRTKADYCRNHLIHLHIDDSKVYGQYFTTPYCLLEG